MSRTFGQRVALAVGLTAAVGVGAAAVVSGLEPSTVRSATPPAGALHAVPVDGLHLDVGSKTNPQPDEPSYFPIGVWLESVTDPADIEKDQEAGLNLYVGLTANSFTSVSLDPPLLLFCLDRRSRRAPVFQSAERFAVNVLHAGQEALSTRFARGTSEGMDGVDLVEEDGAPVLRDAMAVFSCRPHAAYDGGDHCILIGRVSRLRFEPGQDPLIYFQGRYRSVHVPE
ncbi:MAG: flavin reductase family protein [Proteobacteria bacterium]|nr:flavin reductase family protein [Pseudomonadota bacterium]